MSRQKRTTGRSGFTLIELMIAISIIVVLSAIAIPNVKKYRWSSLGVKCNGNLHAVQIAIHSYTMMNNIDTGVDVPLASVTPMLHRANMTICPLGDVYTLDGWWPRCKNRSGMSNLNNVLNMSKYHFVPAMSTLTQ